MQVWKRWKWSPSTRWQYLHWVRRFRAYCRDRGLVEDEQFTFAAVEEFARRYVGPRLRRRAPRRVLAAADSAVHAWSHALHSLGRPVPDWREPKVSASHPPLIAEYIADRQQHRGVASGTCHRDAGVAHEFLKLLHDRRRPIAAIRARELDDFVTGLARRVSRSTVRDACSSLRAFLRFLQTTGRVRRDVASLVVAPRVRLMEKPPRVMAWSDVQRLLRAIPRDTPTGLRDFAVLLLMVAYGFGAAEVVALRLDGIDWRARVLRLQRPKTGAQVELPLLPTVARALAAYVRKARPTDATTRQVFISARLPRRPISTAIVRHQIRLYGRSVGIRGPLGGHVLRHTHATRQIDAGASPKIVGDILGHRRPASLSSYARVALRHLRAVALAVPR
jgi:site-specific recombinase XerD